MLRKRIPAFLLCAAMLFSLSAGGLISARADTVYNCSSGSALDYFLPYAESVDAFETRTVPCYLGDPDTVSQITIGLLNGISDIPYISMTTFVRLLEESSQALSSGRGDYALEMAPMNEEGSIIAVLRENGALLTMSFVTGQLSVTDIALFMADPGAANAMDVISTGETGDCISISHASSFYRTGNVTEVDLLHYGILPVLQDGEGYLPLQTFSDLFFSRMGLNLLYDGTEVLVTGGITYPFSADDDEEEEEEAGPAGEPASEEPTLSDLYYAAPRHEKSEELCIFTYNELCLALDYNYGLQSEHGIDSFNQLFLQTGLSQQLHSSDAGDVYIALADLCSKYLADLHSGVTAVSCMTELDPNSPEVQDAQALNDSAIVINSLLYDFTRMLYYPEGPVGYEEVGNTAYVTFDSFSFDPGRDYYNTEITNNPEDTIELLVYAHRQITREGSPIKNVVVDLSNNGGGLVDAAACVLSWMLSGATINLLDPVTGAQSSSFYIFDANLDGVCDLLGTDFLPPIRINLFCIISPNSFSCGNLVPYMLERSGRVTLIGRSSGGGACIVQGLSTADGNLFQISGPARISNVLNGSYYSVDTGVDPDVYIANVGHLYDRAYLTDLINELP